MKKSIFLMLLAVVMMAFVSCNKDYEEMLPDQTTVDNPTTVSPFFLKVGGAKYANGDSLWVQPGVQVIFNVNDSLAPAGTYYDWDFCGTSYPGSVTNPQVNISHVFPTATTCTVTITQHPSGNVVTVTVFVAATNPLVQPLEFISSTQNTDGTYQYYFAVRKDRISDQTGTLFQIGDHTNWNQSFTNISTTPTDSMLRFNFRSYNQMLKFNAGRGSTFSEVVGSIYAALGWPNDNNYQVYLEDGVVHLATYTPTIVSPGAVGDNAGPFRATVDAVNVSTFFQISNFVAGLKDNPYFNYRIGTGTWSGNIPLTWYNGYGWAAAPSVPVSAIPPGGAIVSIVYGAAGGQASMGTSAYYVPSEACIQFQVVQVNKSGSPVYEIRKVQK